MNGVSVERVAAGEWVATVDACRADGITLLDVFAAVDHGNCVELVLRLSRPMDWEVRVLSTMLDPASPRVESLANRLPAAAWHEREMAEMFGIAFDGHPDPRPLLLREPAPPAPMRRRTALGKRVERPWPGAEQGQSRRGRRVLAPGVRDEWMGGLTP